MRLRALSTTKRMWLGLAVAFICLIVFSYSYDASPGACFAGERVADIPPATLGWVRNYEDYRIVEPSSVREVLAKFDLVDRSRCQYWPDS